MDMVSKDEVWEIFFNLKDALKYLDLDNEDDRYFFEDYFEKLRKTFAGNEKVKVYTSFDEYYYKAKYKEGKENEKG